MNLDLEPSGDDKSKICRGTESALSARRDHRLMRDIVAGRRLPGVQADLAEASVEVAHDHPGLFVGIGHGARWAD